MKADENLRSERLTGQSTQYKIAMAFLLLWIAVAVVMIVSSLFSRFEHSFCETNDFFLFFRLVELPMSVNTIPPALSVSDSTLRFPCSQSMLS